MAYIKQNFVNGEVLTAERLNAMDAQIEANDTGIEELSAKVEDLELYKFPNVTIIGQPTIQQGQISDFTAENYCQFPFVVDFQNRPFEINMEITTGEDIGNQHNILDSVYGLAFAVRQNRFVVALSTNGTSWNIGEGVGTHTVTPNTTYRIRMTWNGSVFVLAYSTDGGETYIDDISKPLTEQPYPKQILIGVSSDKSVVFNGIVNLNYAHLIISDKTVWQGMDDVGLATRANVSLSNLDAEGEQKLKDIAKTDISNLRIELNELLEHESYLANTGESTEEYVPIDNSSIVEGARLMINGYGHAAISTPSGTSVRTYPVEVGKTYKIVGYGDGTTNRPLLFVANTIVSAGSIAAPGEFDYYLGKNIERGNEEAEYIALRTGYLYITYNDSACGVWEKKSVGDRVYYMDSVRSSVDSINNSVTELNKAVYKSIIDGSSAIVKSVPINAKKVAKVTELDTSITYVRSVLSKNFANKLAVNDVIVDDNGTIKKGVKTAHLPCGRYYIDMSGMGAYTMCKVNDGGTFSPTLYKDQFPMVYTIIDPSGGYVVIYASSVTNLGNMDSMMVARLEDTESSCPYAPYEEILYAKAELDANPHVTVEPFGILEFVNPSEANVPSTVEFVVSGKNDNSITRKEFVNSPNGTKYLPIMKNDGTMVGARVIPKKALFIGNSLTSGWQTFGEAATDSDHDYVAYFNAKVKELEPSYTFERIWATQFERRTSLSDAQAWTATYIDPKLSNDLDLIVVQLSENVVSNASAVATFPTSSAWLLQHLRETCPTARVVWMGVWFDRGWISTLLTNVKKTGCEYVDIRPLYVPDNIAYIGMVYKMDAEYEKTYTVDSFSVNDGAISITFSVSGKQYTSVIPAYSSYTQNSPTNLTVKGMYHVVDTYYASIHPNDVGFLKIAEKMIVDLGLVEPVEEPTEVL